MGLSGVKGWLSRGRLTRRPYLCCVKRYHFVVNRKRFKTACANNPVDEKCVVFEAYQGRQYDGNLRAIYEELVKTPEYSDYHCFWIFNEPEQFDFLNNERTEVMKKGTSEEYKAYAKAKYWFCNVALPDYLEPSDEHFYVETWHGTPLKKLGNDIEYHVDPRQSLREMHHKYKEKGRKMDYLVSPSRFYSEKLTSAFLLNESHPKENIIWECGYPRNDKLFCYTEKEIDAIKKKLGIAKDKKVILYTPTWRDNHFHEGEKFNQIVAFDYEYLCRELGPSFCLLIRYHHQIDVKQEEHKGQVVDVSHYESINDLYAVSDMMITDYSSTMFDYANLKRPMLFYMFDLDEYQHEVRGFYFDIQMELPGPIIQKEQELVPAIRDLFSSFDYEKNEKYQRFNQTYNYLDGPDCAAKVLKKTFS